MEVTSDLLNNLLFNLEKYRTIEKIVDYMQR